MTTINKRINCIVCPLGCEITVQMQDDKIIAIKDFSCPRGQAYATEEMTAPKRVLTSTVKIAGGLLPLLPVVSSQPLPKEKVMACAAALRKINIQAPVQQGDIIIPDILGLGVDIIASRSMAVA